MDDFPASLKTSLPIVLKDYAAEVSVAIVIATFLAFICEKLYDLPEEV